MTRIALSIGLFAALIATFGCGGSSTASSSSPDAPSPSSSSSAPGTRIELIDYKINPAQLTVPAGQVQFNVVNSGQTSHNLIIETKAGERIGGTALIAPGAHTTLSVKLSAGDYKAYCSVSGHRSLGMDSSLTVSP